MQINQATLVSIGVNDYNDLQALSFCQNDAVEFTKAIEQRVKPNRKYLMVSDSEGSTLPTLNNISRVLEETSSAGLSNHDLVIFFFAGHGYSADGKDYLAVYDTTLEDKETALCTDDIIAKLNSSGAGTSLIFIDACRSNVNRSSALFGERTAEMARRKGAVVFFSCSPGEVSQELRQLGDGHGVFTHSLLEIIKSEIVPTPLAIDKQIVRMVNDLCSKHNLRKQRPYTTVFPIQKALLNLFTGELQPSEFGGMRRKGIIIVGPTNAGKTTVGQYLAGQIGFAHSEMSSFAWRRFNDVNDYDGTIQDFMEDEVWKRGDEDIIARDLLTASSSLGNMVICGARRPEEIETLTSQGWDVVPYFLYANSAVRYQRMLMSSDQSRYNIGYKDFLRRDLREYSWGLAKVPSMKGFDLMTNERSIDDLVKKLRVAVDRFEN